jgi:hypothetical protein
MTWIFDSLAGTDSYEGKYIGNRNFLKFFIGTLRKIWDIYKN